MAVLSPKPGAPVGGDCSRLSGGPVGGRGFPRTEAQVQGGSTLVTPKHQDPIFSNSRTRGSPEHVFSLSLGSLPSVLNIWKFIGRAVGRHASHINRELVIYHQVISGVISEAQGV